MRLLLQQHASVDTPDRYGRTALYAAVAAGDHASACVWLLLQSKARLDVVDADGDTPLHHCASIGHAGTSVVVQSKTAN